MKNIVLGGRILVRFVPVGNKRYYHAEPLGANAASNSTAAGKKAGGSWSDLVAPFVSNKFNLGCFFTGILYGEMWIAIIIIVVIVLAWILISNRAELVNPQQESFRSCCWRGCENNCCGMRQISSRDFVVMNPFKWPFSATAVPENIQLGCCGDPYDTRYGC